MPDANKEQTLNALVGAAFGAAGQRCMALSVAVMVGDSKQWIQELVEKAKTLKVNAGHEPNTDIGPVISKRAKARVIDLINSGVEQGAELLLDGRDVQVQGYESGNFVGATIFSGVNTDMRIYKEEIFTVLSIICVDTLDEAIALINANPFGNGVYYSHKAVPLHVLSKTSSILVKSVSIFQFLYQCLSLVLPAQEAQN